MTKTILVICSVVAVLGLLLAQDPGTIAGQRVVAGAGGRPDADPNASQGQTKGPLSLILGPIGDVPEVKRGNPLAPGTDTYYMDRPVEEWPPDEFLSNPDREYDWRDLKAWHYGPMIKTTKIIGNRRIKAGESITLESILEDVTGTQNRLNITYFGPQGRRTTLGAALAPVSPGSAVFRGTLKTDKFIEPGVYRVTYASPDNETQHGKIFHSDHHLGLRGLEFEVLPNPDADVIPPKFEWIRVNTLDAAPGQIRTQRVQDPIPVFAKVTDEKAGVSNVQVRFITPGGHFIDGNLNKVIGKDGIYGAMLSVPEWWEAGEYKLLSAWASDKAGQRQYIYQTTHPALKDAKVIMTQDPAKHDKTAPTLFSIWVDKTAARLGEPVTVFAVLTDDLSGVGTVAVNFAPVPSYIDQARIHLRPVDKPTVVQKSGLDISGNLWTGTLATTIWQEPGEWRVTRVTARDNADNYLDILPEYVPEVGEVKLNFTGGNNLFEQLIKYKKGQASVAPASQPAATAVSQPAAAAAAAPGPTGKVRRIDMTPPHPPRGACLNCHEP